MEHSDDTQRALLNHSVTAPSQLAEQPPTNNNHLPRSPGKRYDRAPGGGTEGSAWMEFKPVINQMDRMLEHRYRARSRTQLTWTIQGKVYNFLERPTGWKCFIYHFTV